MHKIFFGLLVVIASVCAVTAGEKQTAIDEFILEGEGRKTDMTNIEKNVYPDRNLILTITGNAPYRTQSKGKFSLYKDGNRNKIEEITFNLEPGETKSWEFSGDKRAKLISFGIYGNGAIKIRIEQSEKIIAESRKSGESSGKAKTTLQLAKDESSFGASYDSFDALIEDAREAYHSGTNLEAAKNLKKAILCLWNEIPLTAQNPRLVKDQETYQTNKNHKYRLGEPIFVSCQILGHTFKQVGESYAINITTDVLFVKNGQVVAGQQGFGRFDHISPIPNTEFTLDLTYRLSEAPKGKYEIQTMIHDKNSEKSTGFTNQIEII